MIVRTTRARIIHLRNDYKDLMGVIEKHLHEHFASLQDEEETPTVAPNEGPSELRDSMPDTLDEPFAKVNSVVDNSPAASAGLKAGDLIRTFGYVNKANHDGLKKVAECVQGNEGVSRLSRIYTYPMPHLIWHTAIVVWVGGADTLYSKTYSSRCPGLVEAHSDKSSV